MSIVRPILLGLVLLGLVVTGCTRSSDPQGAPGETPSVSSPATALLFCGKNERICTSCDGSRQFCGQFCPDCTPPVHEPAPTTPSDVAATSCRPPLHSCLSCNGVTHFCSRLCPACPAQLAPGGEAIPATLALLGDPACADRI
jgi:hypothetical protein